MNEVKIYRIFKTSSELKENKPLKQEESFTKVTVVQPKLHKEQNQISSNTLHKQVDIGVVSTKEKSNKENTLDDLKISKPLVSNSIMDAKSSTEMSPEPERKNIDLVVYDEKEGILLKFKIKYQQPLYKFLFSLL